MDWIHSYKDLRNHPKTRKLARLVGGLPAAIGYLHCLWWWSMDYAQDGDLSGYDADDIAAGCEWEGEPGDIVEALIVSGFLDSNDDGSLCIHAYQERIGKYQSRAVADAAAKRAARAERNDAETAAYGRRTDGVRTACAGSTDGVRTASRASDARRGEERRVEEKDLKNSLSDSDESAALKQGQPVDNGGNSVEVQLTQGLVARIDADDEQRLAAFSWHAFQSGDRWYAATKVKRFVVPMHRMVLGLDYGEEVEKDVHHINGDTLDNRKANLTLLTRSEHLWEHRRVSEKSKSPPACDGQPRKVTVTTPTEQEWEARSEVVLATTAFAAEYQRLAELLAGENKTGKAALSRVVRELYEPLLHMEGELPQDAMRAGLQAAISNAAPNYHYVHKAALGYATKPPGTRRGLDGALETLQTVHDSYM